MIKYMLICFGGKEKKAVANYSLHLKIISNFKIRLLICGRHMIPTLNSEKNVYLPLSAKEKDYQNRNRLCYHFLSFGTLNSSMN